jgi:hypothetical protein
LIDYAALFVREETTKGVALSHGQRRQLMAVEPSSRFTHVHALMMRRQFYG